MNRRLARSLAFHGTIGVIATILSAWLCQFIPSSTYDATPLAPGEWPFAVPVDWPVKPDSAIGDANWASNTVVRTHNLDRYAETARSDPAVIMHSTVEREYGVPMRAIECLQASKTRLRIITPVDVPLIRAGISMPQVLQNGFANRERLAVSPIFTGFACNTIFYGVLSWLSFIVVARPHAKRRRRAGRCIRCGYSLAGNTDGICPECGTTAPDRKPLSPATS